VTDGAHVDDGVRDCYANGWRCLSWCSVLMAATTS
jgi:hypothetical protein